MRSRYGIGPHAKAQSLVGLGAVLAPTPRAAAAEREAVLTMLADDSALESVLSGPQGLLEGLRRGAVHISLSTIAVATAEETDRPARRAWAAPVVRARVRPPGGGGCRQIVRGRRRPKTDVDGAKALFDAISQRVFYIGETPSAANLVKLCGNFMILAAIETMAEAMTLAQRGGVAKKQFVEVMTGSLFDAPVYRNYGNGLVKERFKPAGFAAPLGLKDMRLVGESADALRVPMPVLNVLRDHLLQTIAAEGEDVDWSAIGRTVAKNGGLS